MTSAGVDVDVELLDKLPVPAASLPNIRHSIDHGPARDESVLRPGLGATERLGLSERVSPSSKMAQPMDGRPRITLWVFRASVTQTFHL